MNHEQFIKAEEFCASHEIEFSFVSLLSEWGLVEVTVIEDKGFIPESQLPKLEKLARLHYDLQINLEGIDAIANLRERVSQMQEENIVLKNKLRYYEEMPL